MNNIYQEARSYNTIMKALEFALKEVTKIQ